LYTHQRQATGSLENDRGSNLLLPSPVSASRWDAGYASEPPELGDGRPSYDEVPETGTDRVCLIAAIHEAHGRSHSGALPGAHVAIEDLLLGEDTHDRCRYLLPHRSSEELPLADHLLNGPVWGVALLTPGFVLALGSMVAHVEIEVRPQALTNLPSTGQIAGGSRSPDSAEGLLRCPTHPFRGTLLPRCLVVGLSPL
jgi:hypothetical protein